MEEPRVGEVMRAPEQRIMAAQPLMVARQRMEATPNVKSLIVVDNEDHFLGMVRHEDVQRGSGGTTVQDVTLTAQPTAQVDQLLTELAGVMTAYNIDRLAVVDPAGRVIGEVPRAAVTLGEATTTAATPIQPALADAQANTAGPTAAIYQGMDVVDNEGRKVGTVQAVSADLLDGAARHIVVRSGLLFHRDRALPVDLIADVAGDTVRLQCSKSDIAMLPTTNT